MSENEFDLVTYTKEHQNIVKSGIDDISKILNGRDVEEKRSLLFCLDKYLDPYYGYNLPYFDDIMFLLQKRLFVEADKDVKDDILQLLTDYSRNSLDYLADNIEMVEPELLEDAIYALELTYNQKYVPIFIKYEFHENPHVQVVAKEALTELSKLNFDK
ncbi:hypothetical protein RBH29_16435 [Herbivorax sp. ANBcel31]|uniref:hypothetical protein n=1 Tax=Herbivorax sp. ANBcel31 TaxID=3069754 RepID=UPI0027B6DB88|nr:hypothetical protein [Herbivorax sp. ANBcel31]MDQ2088018.1 hypothetical protein [Herbivorax sp. ANBcel31]